jgi:hypothetical protein
MNRLDRHEAFQRVVARGATMKGAIVISASTNAPCDLVIVTVRGVPLLVEIKTVGRGSHASGEPPLQKALRLRVGESGGFGVVHARVTRRIKRSGPSVSVSTTPPNPWVESYLMECARAGEGP